MTIKISDVAFDEHDPKGPVLILTLGEPGRPQTEIRLDRESAARLSAYLLTWMKALDEGGRS